MCQWGQSEFEAEALVRFWVTNDLRSECCTFLCSSGHLESRLFSFIYCLLSLHSLSNGRSGDFQIGFLEQCGGSVEET